MKWSLSEDAAFSASQEFPRLLRGKNFISVSKSSFHLSLSWARWVECTHTNHEFLRCTLTLSSHLFLERPGNLFLSSLSDKTRHVFLLCPYVTNSLPITTFLLKSSILTFVCTALQAENYRFPMLFLKFFIDLILRAALWTWGRLSP